MQLLHVFADGVARVAVRRPEGHGRAKTSKLPMSVAKVLFAHNTLAAARDSISPSTNKLLHSSHQYCSNWCHAIKVSCASICDLARCHRASTSCRNVLSSLLHLSNLNMQTCEAGS